MDRDEMLRALAALAVEGVEYVLIGAAAMGIHGIVRATEDLDIVVRATPDNIERLRRALRAAYDNDAAIDEIATEDLLGDYPAVRYYPPSGDLYFDILTRLGEVANYESIEAEIKDIGGGVRATGATPRALDQLKRGVVRSGRVHRFRSVEEMGAAVVRPSTSDGFERFARHCARYWALSPRTYPRGVFKFRSLEDAQAARARVNVDGRRR